MTKTQKHLYYCGFIQTQPDFYETPLDKTLWLGTHTKGKTTYYQLFRKDQELTSGKVKELEKNFSLVNNN